MNTKGLISLCVCLLLIQRLYGQEQNNQISGKFENYMPTGRSNKVVLVGFKGKVPTNFDTTIVAQDGSFQMRYPQTYTGMGLMQLVGTQGEIPLVLLGETPIKQNVSIINGGLVFSEGSPNAVYHAYKQNSDKYKQQLDLLGKLNKHYDAKSTFGQSLVTEQKLTEEADTKLTSEIDALKNDVSYFLRLNQNLTTMNNLLGGNEQPPIEKLKAAQEYFEHTVSFADDRLWHSGIIHRLIYSYYSLSSVLEGGHQHASDFLARQLVTSASKNIYIEEIIGVIQGQVTMAEYFSQKTLEVSQQCDEIKGNDIPSKIKRQLEQHTYMKVGMTAPNELLSNGKRIADLEGNYKLIVFWASWCEHCQKEIPELQAIYADLKKQNIEVVAMGMDDNADIHKIVTQSHPWISQFVGRDWNAPMTQHYFVYGTPTFFMVDKNMKIVAKPRTVSDLKKWLVQTGVNNMTTAVK